MARKLRIAVSVFFGVLTVALCVLWVRSYTWADYIHVNRSTRYSFYFETQRGELFGCFGSPVDKTSWVDYGEFDVESNYRNFDYATLGFYFGGDDMFPGLVLIVVPCWFFVTATAAFVAAPWTRWFHRFSLRTLLIATTLVAVVLGLAVWVKPI